MGRGRKNKSGRRIAQSAPKLEDGKKLVYVSVHPSVHPSNLTDNKISSWVKIDAVSDTTFRFEAVPKMKIPDNIELCKLYGYSWIAHGSKVYFIGGMYKPAYVNFRDDSFPDDPSAVFSKKMFIYDIDLQTWEESISGLNVGRSFSVVVLVNNHIMYVFGRNMYCEFERENWIECYDLKDTENGWQLLCTTNPDSIPLEPLFENSRSIRWHAVHERGSQILFSVNCTSLEEVFSFDYVTKTWKVLPLKLGNRPLVARHIAIEQDVLIWHHFGTIWGYDLRKNKIVLEHSISHIRPFFGSQNDFRDYPRVVFLERVAKNKLLLVWGQYFSSNGHMNVGCEISCYRFRIEETSSNDSSCYSSQDNSLGYVLVPDGSGTFPTQGVGLHECILV